MPRPQEIAARVRSFIADTVLPVEREVIVDGRTVDDALRAALVTTYLNLELPRDAAK